MGGSGTTLCGATSVADSQWHHVAVTRRSTGAMALYIDSQPTAPRRASGDASYRNGRTSPGPTIRTSCSARRSTTPAASIPPSAAGWTELRISTSVRYTAAFAPEALFATDGATAALYHFDEGQGTTLGDTSGAAGGPSDGTLAWAARHPANLGPDTPFSTRHKGLHQRHKARQGHEEALCWASALCSLCHARFAPMFSGSTGNRV